jgi:hypothetical protein
MAGSVRSLVFDIRWDIQSSPLANANRQTDQLTNRMGGLGRAAAGTGNGIRGIGTTAEQTARRANRSFMGMGRVLKNTLGVLGVIHILDKVRDGITESIKLASDLVEVQNVVDVTFKKSSKEIDKWASTALDNFGLSTLQAKQFNGQIGSIIKSSGITGKPLVKMSENLSGLAGDFASFHNIDQETAFKKISSGITGQVAPLRTLGISMTVANLEAYAFANGIKTTYKQMDQASKTMLRYSYLMNISKSAQGDFIRTQKEFANQSRLLTQRFKELGAKIATAILPSLTKLLNLGNELLGGDFSKIKSMLSETFGKGSVKVFDSFVKSVELGFGIMAALFKGNKKDTRNKLAKFLGITPEQAKSIITTITNVKDKIMKNVINVIKTSFTVISKIFTFVKENFRELTPIIAGIAASMVSYKAIMIGSAAATKIMVAAQWLFNVALTANPIGIVIVAIGALVAAGVALYLNWDKITGAMQDLWVTITEKFPFIEKIVDEGMDRIGKFINSFIKIFKGVIIFFQGVFTDDWGKIWEGIGNIFGGIWDGILVTFKDQINGMIDLANSLISKLDIIGIKVPKIGKILSEKEKLVGSVFTGNKNTSTTNKLDNAISTDIFNKLNTKGKTTNSSNKFPVGAPIKKYARGINNFGGGAAIINDGYGGGEMAIMPSGSQVIPADKTDKMLNRKNISNTFAPNISINVSGGDAKSISKEVEKSVSRILTDKMEEYFYNLSLQNQSSVEY